MKSFYLSLFLICMNFMHAENSPAIIPLPQEFQSVPEKFELKNGTEINFNDPLLWQQAYYLQKELLDQEQITTSFSNEKQAKGIILDISELKNKKVGAYILSMNKHSVKISASEQDGIFNGIISFLQLVRKSKNNVISCWHIEDAPLYEWRGLMLDESRHFFGKEKVKMLLDWMAFYKLNKFHWHLTDQHGWRIEIQKYPLLSYVGGIGDLSNPYGIPKYYTQKEIKEIIAYAAERQITVIPEIDMPGHATAANRAYPQFSGGGSKEYPDFTFNPGNEDTYQYLTDILREVNTLFPSEMIHLGGDEVSFGNQLWKKNESIVQLMKKNNLKTIVDVERYFMARMADTLFSMNNKFLAWDEMGEADFPKDQTIIFWWRHDKKDVLMNTLRNGYNIVLCPRIPFYFDFIQDDTHKVGRRWNGFSSLEQVYSFRATDVMSKIETSQVLGIQANIWTEEISSNQRLDFMTFPRIAALAEAGWNENKDYEKFLHRLKPHLEFYRKENIYFFNPFQPEENVEVKR